MTRHLNRPSETPHSNLSSHPFTPQTSNQSIRRPRWTFPLLARDSDLLLILTLQKNSHLRRQELTHCLYPFPHLNLDFKSLARLHPMRPQEPSLNRFNLLAGRLIFPFLRARRGPLLPFSYRFRFCFRLEAPFPQDLALVSLQTTHSFLTLPCLPCFYSKVGCQANRQLRQVGHHHHHPVFENY